MDLVFTPTSTHSETADSLRTVLRTSCSATLVSVVTGLVTSSLATMLFHGYRLEYLSPQPDEIRSLGKAAHVQAA